MCEVIPDIQSMMNHSEIETRHKQHRAEHIDCTSVIPGCDFQSKVEERLTRGKRIIILNTKNNPISEWGTFKKILKCETVMSVKRVSTKTPRLDVNIHAAV